jgi:CheY-like chemotaxis protein
MKDLLDDLLDVSRVTRGMVTLKHEILDLNVVLHDAVEQAQVHISKKNQHLCSDLPALPCIVTGDRTRLIQIFSNLLNNSSKFTDAEGNIYLKVSVESDRVKVAIRDCGIGIAPSLLPFIFDPFTQGDRSPDRSQGGLGLGLSLVKSLVQLHGGDVSAHSEGIGEGSTFEVQLLRAAVASVAADENCAPRQQIGARAGPARSLLVVDDNEDAADTMGMLLETMGHPVGIAYNAADALAMARRLSPAVLFLDIGMPDMDGYTLARKLRELPETRGAFLVALTGYGQPEDVRRAMEAGFDRHLVKPVSLSVALSALQQAASREEATGIRTPA